MIRRLKRRESPRPLFRGDVVTVCIAAICTEVNKIAFVSDTMMSSDWISTQGILKMRNLDVQDKWQAMFAGHSSRFIPLVGRIKAELVGKGAIVEQVINACEAAYKIEHVKLVETEILLPYGITLEDCIQHGREWFGELRHGAVLDKIEGIENSELAIDLLVAGFDATGSPHIFEMDRNGIITRPLLKFHAIGVGRSAALATLYPQPSFCSSKDINAIVYKLCAAKFAAESAPGVGGYTAVMLGSPNAEWHAMVGKPIDQLRELWKAKGQPLVPAGAADLIQASLQLLDLGG